MAIVSQTSPMGGWKDDTQSARRLRPETKSEDADQRGAIHAGERLMTLTITPTGATLGAIVTGVDLANLDDAAWADIERAFLAHAVLIFPGQHLSDAAQIGFGRRFGAI